MTGQMLRCLIAAGVLALLGSNPGEPEVATLRPRFDSVAGRWKVIRSEQFEGKQFRGDQFKGYQLSLDERQLKVSGTAYAYRLDPDHEPRWIDITVEGKRVEGIYQLEGQRLSLCYPMAGKGSRPTRFAAQADTAVVLLVMEKE